MDYPGSLPVWGEWIEIFSDPRKGVAQASLPVWGEWIEISIALKSRPHSASLPVWGEWIEIGMGNQWVTNRVMSLPVWGEWIEIQGPVYLLERLFVSPRVGRVD